MLLESLAGSVKPPDLQQSRQGQPHTTGGQSDSSIESGGECRFVESQFPACTYSGTKA
jgi:hypothetical protein